MMVRCSDMLYPAACCTADLLVAGGVDCEPRSTCGACGRPIPGSAAATAPAEEAAAAAAAAVVAKAAAASNGVGAAAASAASSNGSGEY